MKIIVIGCGRTGASLAQTLSQRSHTVTVVDKDPTAFERLGASFTGQKVTGVSFDREVLLQAGIERTDGLATVTGSDETNVVVARLARRLFKVPRVVARLYDPWKAEVYRRLGLQTVNPLSWSVHRIAELVCYSPLDAVASLGSGEVDVVEIAISPLLAGRTVSEITIPGEVHVVAVSREGKTFLPTLGTVFHEQDVLHLAVVTASAERLKALLSVQ
jgi:trk system potassium uptake protein TrkA